MAVENSHIPARWFHIEDGLESEKVKVPSLQILLNGRGLFGKDVLELLEADGHTFPAVIAPKNPNDPLRLAAEQRGIPIINLGTIDKPEVQDHIRELGADLGIAADVTRIIPPKVAQAPEKGTILFHPAFSPMHAGRSAIQRAIIAGDQALGAACLWIEDEGKPNQLDSGRILARVQIEFDDENITAGGAYKTGIAPIGAVLIRNSARLVALGYAPRLTHEEELTSYEHPITKADVRVNWDKTAEVVHNTIRGAQNSPGSWTTFSGMKEGEIINLFDAVKQRRETLFEPGTVIEISDAGVEVAVQNGSVLIRTMQVSRVSETDGELEETQQKGNKMAANIFAQEINLEPGVHFLIPSSS